MSFLDKVSSGLIDRPYYVLVHGIPGIGKSTFAAGFPKPLFLCSEKRTGHLDINRLELETFPEFLSVLDEVKKTPRDYKTIVIDTVDHLERMIHKVVAKENNKESIEDIGYNKGFDYAIDHWAKLTDSLESIRDMHQINIALLAHTYVKTFNDPQQTVGYDRYQVKLHHKAASFLMDRVDACLFANYETFVKKDDSGKARAMGEGVRLMYTERRPAFDAKNSYNLPFKMSFAFEDFDRQAKSGKSREPVEIRKNIAELAIEIKDKDTREKVLLRTQEAGDDTKKLVEIENRVKAIVAQ